jgi:hypothetical protein
LIIGILKKSVAIQGTTEKIMRPIKISHANGSDKT